MSYGATLAGVAFQLPKNAMVHACSFPLSARYHLPHGAACAFTLEEAIRLNAPAMGERMTRFLHGIGLASADDLIALDSGVEATGRASPARSARREFRTTDIPQLARESLHPLMRNNPRDADRGRPDCNVPTPGLKGPRTWNLEEISTARNSTAWRPSGAT